MTMREDEDPTRAAIRVAEGVVGLVRAELGLAAARARSAGSRLAVTLALSVASLFTCALAVVVVVLTPVLWAFRPAAALASLALALTFALVPSLVTLKRWRAQPATNDDEDSIPPVHHELPGSDHAIPR
jgi:predicted MFS family arabinose efflux permease